MRFVRRAGRPGRPGQTTCACGGTSETFQKPIEFRIGVSVQLLKSVTTTVWEKHWRWIFVYAFVQIVIAVVSYWTSNWISVAWSIVGGLASTGIGFFIVMKAVTTVTELGGKQDG